MMSAQQTSAAAEHFIQMTLHLQSIFESTETKAIVKILIISLERSEIIHAPYEIN